MFALECLDARHGDCLILHYGTKSQRQFVLIDGGPPGVYRDKQRGLRKRLAELREDFGNGGPLQIELGMVSHIDEDHIAGILDMFRELDREPDRDKHLVEFKKFWHNSLAHLVVDESGAQVAMIGAAITASVAPAMPVAENALDHTDGRAASILASVKQGADLAAILVKFGLHNNGPFGSAVKSGALPVPLGDLSIDVVWPDAAALGNLKREWKTRTSAVQIAEYLDKSVANLSSIVCVARCEGKSMLLTGDARGDDILKGLKLAGILPDDGTCHFDLLKMPHHGSDRNMETGFLATVLADVYVFSADGKHDNPDPPTFEMLRAARPGAKYTVVVTNPVKMETPSRQIAYEDAIRRFRDDPNVTLEIREVNDPSVTVTLS